MEQVLDFAVCELGKIVEASFEDLLLEITVKEREHQELEERLRCSRPENGKSRASRRRCSEPDAASSPGSPDAACDDAGDVPGAKIARKEDEETNGLCVFGTLDSL